MRPTPGWPWRSSACRKKPTRSPPFPTCSIISPKPANSPAPSSASSKLGMGTQVDIADAILGHKADFLLPLKGNQPTLEADVIDYFGTAPKDELVVKETVEKAHGRIETRSFAASNVVDWISSARSYPGQPRFNGIKTILKVVNRTEYADRCTFDSRYYICSAPLDIDRLAEASRGHWGVESFHWLLDIEFKDDLSRYRCGHGAANMAIVRRFALGLVRSDQRKDEAELKALIERN